MSISARRPAVSARRGSALRCRGSGRHSASPRRPPAAGRARRRTRAPSGASVSRVAHRPASSTPTPGSLHAELDRRERAAVAPRPSASSPSGDARPRLDRGSHRPARRPVSPVTPAGASTREATIAWRARRSQGHEHVALPRHVRLRSAGAPLPLVDAGSPEHPPSTLLRPDRQAAQAREDEQRVRRHPSARIAQAGSQIHALYERYGHRRAMGVRRPERLKVLAALLLPPRALPGRGGL